MGKSLTDVPPPSSVEKEPNAAMPAAEQVAVLVAEGTPVSSVPAQVPIEVLQESNRPAL